MRNGASDASDGSSPQPKTMIGAGAEAGVCVGSEKQIVPCFVFVLFFFLFVALAEVYGISGKSKSVERSKDELWRSHWLAVTLKNAHGGKNGNSDKSVRVRTLKNMVLIKTEDLQLWRLIFSMKEIQRRKTFIDLKCDLNKFNLRNSKN